jgi:hypothetical protein
MLLILKGRKAAARAEQQAPIDTDADAKLEREAKDEERAINRICNELGLEMHEVLTPSPSPQPTHISYHIIDLNPLPHMYTRIDQPRRPLSLLSSCRPTRHPERRPATTSALHASAARGGRIHASAPTGLCALPSECGGRRRRGRGRLWDYWPAGVCALLREHP